jgi:hypothetical protein
MSSSASASSPDTPTTTSGNASSRPNVLPSSTKAATACRVTFLGLRWLAEVEVSFLGILQSLAKDSIGSHAVIYLHVLAKKALSVRGWNWEGCATSEDAPRILSILVDHAVQAKDQEFTRAAWFHDLRSFMQEYFTPDVVFGKVVVGVEWVFTVVVVSGVRGVVGGVMNLVAFAFCEVCGYFELFQVMFLILIVVMVMLLLPPLRLQNLTPPNPSHSSHILSHSTSQQA